MLTNRLVFPLAIIGITLGIAGLTEKNKKKTMSIIGLTLNVGPIFVMFGAFLIAFLNLF